MSSETDFSFRASDLLAGITLKTVDCRQPDAFDRSLRPNHSIRPRPSPIGALRHYRGSISFRPRHGH